MNYILINIPHKYIPFIPYGYSKYGKYANSYAGEYAEENEYYNPETNEWVGSEDDGYGNSYYGSFYCEEHAKDEANYLIEADCYECNEIVKSKGHILCSICGDPMQEREYSHYCTVCDRHKIKI